MAQESPEPQDRAGRRVLIAIPTYGRPGSIQRCLDSIAALIPPERTDVGLLLLDNNPDRDAQPIFERAERQLKFPATYVHVATRGIPHVRNRAVEAALDRGVEFLAFLDDDETAPPEWLLEAFRALDRYGGDVVSGPQVRVLPEGSPYWMRKSTCLGVVKWAKREGPGPGPVSTNNVVFSTRLIRDWGLRFRTDFNLSGGSDTVFFEEAIRRGARVVWARRAHVYETVPESRARLGWMLRRDFRLGVNRIRRARLFDGELAAWRTLGASLWDVLVVRVFNLFVHEFTRTRGRAFGKRFTVRVVNYLGHASRALGMISALFGYKYEEYRHATHGD